MNAVERVIQYSKTPSEAPTHATPDHPHLLTAPADWPAAGAIEFDRLVLCYRPGLPPVLRGISCNIAAGEKIGIVGRTGLEPPLSLCLCRYGADWCVGLCCASQALESRRFRLLCFA
jgi:hypothetical protein